MVRRVFYDLQLVFTPQTPPDTCSCFEKGYALLKRIGVRDSVESVKVLQRDRRKQHKHVYSCFPFLLAETS